MCGEECWTKDDVGAECGVGEFGMVCVKIGVNGSTSGGDGLLM